MSDKLLDALEPSNALTAADSDFIFTADGPFDRERIDALRSVAGELRTALQEIDRLGREHPHLVEAAIRNIAAGVLARHGGET